MALVAYDYESGSEEEHSDAENTASNVILIENAPKKIEQDLNEENSTIITSLSHLPKTKTVTTDKQISEDTLEDFIPKYQPSTEKPPKQKVKISIPSLSDFQDDDEEQRVEKKTKTSSKSGLLSLLPPVKGSPLSTKSFVPHVLKNKPPPKAKNANNPLVPHSIRKKAEAARAKALKLAVASTSSDLESEDEELVLPETFDEEMWQKACGRSKNRPKLAIIEAEEPVSTPMPLVDIAPEPQQPYEGLDNVAFKELVGKSKRPINIKLVDINEDEIITDKDMWLTKSLTDPEQAPKPVIENPVDPTRKRKHHITYLAEQAKANAQDLETQWSASKHSRSQTRAKYGF